MESDFPRAWTGIAHAYPAYRPLEAWDRAYVLGLAAAACQDAWDLCGNVRHVERICSEFRAVAAELAFERSAHKETRLELAAARKTIEALEMAAGLNNQIRGIRTEEFGPAPDVVDIEVPGQKEDCDDEY